MLTVLLAGEVGDTPGAALIESNMLNRRVGMFLRYSGPNRVSNPLPRASMREPDPWTTMDSATPASFKTAVLSIRIREGSFETRAQDITIIASRHGGFIASSRTSGGKFLSGTIVLRIPASQFEIALGELKALGKVTGEQISGEDVTAQFVDLQARLRNWEAQEDVLLKLMAKSKSIEESLKVQRALQDVINGLDPRTTPRAIAVNPANPAIVYLATLDFGLFRNDLRLGIIEASNGKIGSPVDAVLLYCFHYDASTGRYSLLISNVVKMLASVTAIALFGLIGAFVWREHRVKTVERPC